jgi:thioredoxin-dependent peroxiredoxin
MSQETAMKTAALCLLVVLAAAEPGHGQTADPKASPPAPAPRTDESARTPRPQVRIRGRIYVGERAPDFSLTNAQGRDLKLSRTRGNWVLLSFGNRVEALGGLRAIHADMQALGVTMLGVAHEKPQRLRAVAERDTIPFELLADVTGEIAAMYGLLDQQNSAILPGFMMLDRTGVVRLAVLGQALPPEQIGQLARFTVVGL